MDRFTVTTCYPGNVADTTIVFAVEQNCTLLHVSAVVANDGCPTIAIAGSTAGTVLTAIRGGSNNTPAEWDFADFDTYAASRSFPRFVKGETVTVTVDVLPETAPTNLTVVLTFADE